MTEFERLGDESFVSLTTFRRSGEPISTPVWIARDGDALIVTTPEESGKVKRLRNNESVELRPCSRRGKVDARVDPVAAVAEIVTDESASRRMARHDPRRVRPRVPDRDVHRTGPRASAEAAGPAADHPGKRAGHPHHLMTLADVR